MSATGENEPREEVSPNGVPHLVIGRWCLTCGDLWRHAEWGNP